LQEKKYECFRKRYLPAHDVYADAIRTTMEFMEAPLEKIKTRTAYNVSTIIFSPKEIAVEIKKYIPEFEISCMHDSRQNIANSWLQSIDDKEAIAEWGSRGMNTI
jgi:hypothetical protein